MVSDSDITAITIGHHIAVRSVMMVSSWHFFTCNKGVQKNEMLNAKLNDILHLGTESICVSALHWPVLREMLHLTLSSQGLAELPVEF